MKGKKLWRASSNGPDWIDIGMMLRSLEQLHQVFVSVRLHSDGSGTSNGLRIFCTAYGASLMGSGTAGVCGVMGDWPNANAAEMPGLVYRLLTELDAKLSAEVWEQMVLPGTE